MQPINGRVLYEKVGRRYVPVEADTAWERVRFGHGNWVLTCDKNGLACRKLGKASPEQTALLMRLQDALSKRLMEIPLNFPDTTPEQTAKLFRAYKRIVGRDAVLVWGRDSLRDIVEQAITEVSVLTSCQANRRAKSTEKLPMK